MSFRRLGVAVAFIGMLSSANVQAVSVAFPSASSTINASAGTYFFLSSHSVSETFTATGLPSLTSLGLHLDLATNSLVNGAHVDFDVLVNGVDVGDISFARTAGTGAFDFLFNFLSIAGLGGGDDYNLLLDENNNVPGGEGSISFDQVNSTATLNGSGTVPEPGTIVLAGLGLLGLAGRRYLRA